MSVMRSLARGVVHHRMDIAGYIQVNKRGRKNDKATSSFFSTHWRDYLKKTQKT